MRAAVFSGFLISIIGVQFGTLPVCRLVAFVVRTKKEATMERPIGLMRQEIFDHALITSVGYLCASLQPCKNIWGNKNPAPQQRTHPWRWKAGAAGTVLAAPTLLLVDPPFCKKW